MVTSRSQLRSLAAREGAHRVDVDRLSAADSALLLSGRLTAQHERIDHAQNAELADLCGHLPVALTVAAERFARLSVDGIRDELEELRDQTRRLDALATGDDPLTDVRAVFDSSYRLLGSDAAQFLRTLGTVPDTRLSLDAAAATAGVPPRTARRLLDTLVECHLVDQVGPRWYGIHDLVRAYAGGLAADDPEGPAAQARLRSWCVHVAERARMAMSGTATVLPFGALPDGVEVQDFLGAEPATTWYDEHRRLLKAVVDDAVSDGDSATVYRLANGFAKYLNMVCADAEERDVLRMAVDGARANGEAVAVAVALNEHGVRFGRDGAYDDALAAFREAADQFACAGEIVGEHRARCNEAQALKLAGWTAAAVDLLEREVARVRMRGLDQEHWSSLNQLAGAYLVLGRFADAVASATQAAAAQEARGEEPLAAHSLGTLGAAQAALGRLPESEAAYQRSFQSFRALGDVSNAVRILQQHGEALRDHGQTERARELWLRALELLGETGAAEDDHATDLRRLLATADPRA